MFVAPDSDYAPGKAIADSRLWIARPARKDAHDRPQEKIFPDIFSHPGFDKRIVRCL